MLDYTGDFEELQRKLDTHGIDFDVANLCGATLDEIEQYVNMLISEVEHV